MNESKFFQRSPVTVLRSGGYNSVVMVLECGHIKTRSRACFPRSGRLPKIVECSRCRHHEAPRHDYGIGYPDPVPHEPEG